MSSSVMVAHNEFEAAVASSLEHTASYAPNPEWQSYWLGFTDESRNLRAQQLRTFGRLLGSVTRSLSGWRILDVGCGAGGWLRTFIEYDARPEDLVGIDISDSRFQIGRAKNPLIQLIQTDGMSIPFGDAQFHLVTQFVCFSNVPTDDLRQRVAAEIRRVVQSGGFIFWWDLPYTTAPSAPRERLRPQAYFDWPMRQLSVGAQPRPSECLRPLRGMSRFLGVALDRLGYRPTHNAALIGPKP